jgi:hypothetical protein
MRLRGDERVSALARVVSGEGADVDVVGEEILDDRAAETEPSEG